MNSSKTSLSINLGITTYYTKIWNYFEYSCLEFHKKYQKFGVTKAAMFNDWLDTQIDLERKKANISL